MSKDFICPKCGEEMEKWGVRSYCKKCDTQYRIKYKCEKCNEEPEELAACGSQAFFCNKCNELKAKRTMIKEYIEVVK